MSMKWALRELRIIAADPMWIDETVDVEKSVQQKQADVLGLSPLSVTGLVLYEKETVLLQLDVVGMIKLPSTRSLTPVEQSLAFKIRERLIPEGVTTDIVDEDDTIPVPLATETVDLNTILIDNVVTHIPVQVYTEEEMANDNYPQGNEWQVVSEDNYKEHEQEENNEGDPRFAKLKDLFDNENND